MRHWFRVNHDLVDEPVIQRLRDKDFVRKLRAAIRGEENEFTPFIRRDSGRVFSAEWRRIRSQIFERDDYTCQYCGVRGGRLECDHVTPVSKGGKTSEDNLVTACFACNRSKRDKTLDEWGALNAN